uniref:Uncharacterized protein n=1 Tax=Cyprinodon variegatus TaxID=28743 RepID=A0A3Q2CRL3_CYPVA
MAYQTLQQEYLQIPVVTRAYTTACVLTTAAVVRPTRTEPNRTESVSQSVRDFQGSSQPPAVLLHIRFLAAHSGS